MVSMTQSQRAQLRNIVAVQPIVRAQELRNAGIAGSTIQRSLDDGDLVRIGRGLYQSPQCDIEGDHALAGVSKRIPKGVIAMVSALAYHGLTD